MIMKVIFLVDMQSFYASLEKARDPRLDDKPVIVAGDPKRRSGVVLAACPLAKKRGVKNASRLWEALQKCPEAVVVPPRMEDYVIAATGITAILETFTPLVEPYSIDEQFMDVTGSQKLFGSPYKIARMVQTAIWEKYQVRARVGIGENKVLAKMACDNFSKKSKGGVFWLKKDELEEHLWPLPVGSMFGVGSRMEQHLRNMAIRTIGHLAACPVERLKKRWGINGHVLWMTANGIDYSPVSIGSHQGEKTIGHGMTLPYDYTTRRDIRVVLLELCEEVCSRARRSHVMGQTISLSVSGGSYMIPASFHRQKTIASATNVTMEMYSYICELFDKFWDGFPVRRLAVSLDKLQSDKVVQLSLFEQDRDRLLQIGSAMDRIKGRYGQTSIIRASSLLSPGQARERAAKIGGHYK
ncbi:DNA polymerase IV [Alkalihalobacillus oceani]|uniref:DNA polymerase IV n=2 Tax=Halalkalibacter oceani TaxID=1653776 RepID=A0A9X2DU38_9BACI|nr:DNA polymerase IV [Halalkalibacter oceani]